MMTLAWQLLVAAEAAQTAAALRRAAHGPAWAPTANQRQPAYPSIAYDLCADAAPTSRVAQAVSQLAKSLYAKEQTSRHDTINVDTTTNVIDDDESLGVNPHNPRTRVHNHSRTRSRSHSNARQANNTPPPPSSSVHPHDAASTASLLAPVFSSEDPPLAQALLALREHVLLLRSRTQLDPCVLLDPFCNVIQNGSTTGPTTAVALAALDKFLVADLVAETHPRVRHAVLLVVSACTRCRFEATDPTTDEIVLDRLLRLLRSIVVSPLGKNNLDDKSICEIVEVAFGIYFQSRVSELLRRSAEETLAVIVRVLFQRVANLINVRKAYSRAFRHQYGHHYMDPISNQHNTPTLHSTGDADVVGPIDPDSPTITNGGIATTVSRRSSFAKFSQRPKSDHEIEELAILDGSRVVSPTDQSTTTTLIASLQIPTTNFYQQQQSASADSIASDSSLHPELKPNPESIKSPLSPSISVSAAIPGISEQPFVDSNSSSDKQTDPFIGAESGVQLKGSDSNISTNNVSRTGRPLDVSMDDSPRIDIESKTQTLRSRGSVEINLYQGHITGNNGVTEKMDASGNISAVQDDENNSNDGSNSSDISKNTDILNNHGIISSTSNPSATSAIGVSSIGGNPATTSGTTITTTIAANAAASTTTTTTAMDGTSGTGINISTGSTGISSIHGLGVISNQQQIGNNNNNTLSAKLPLTLPADDIPFGLPAAFELLRVLATLLDPKNRRQTDSLHRFISLKLLMTACQSGGNAFGDLLSWGYDILTYEGSKLATVDSNPLDGLDKQNSVLKAHLPSTEERFVYLSYLLITDPLCKYLFQLIQQYDYSFNNPPPYTVIPFIELSVRTLTALLQVAGCRLRPQLEYYLEWAMYKLNAGLSTITMEAFPNSSVDGPTMSRSTTETSITPNPYVERSNSSDKRGRATVNEIRELLLESLYQLCQCDNFFSLLYVNFDADLSQPSHMFENLVLFLTAHAFADKTPQGSVTSSVHQSYCFDSLCLLIREIVNNFEENKKAMLANYDPDFGTKVPTADEAQHSKLRKRLLDEGIQLFNESPKKALPFFVNNGFLSHDYSSIELARFLQNTPRLSKKTIGEYISRPENLPLLAAFVEQYNFSGKRLDEALRALLETFRLPGEAQQIARVMETFSNIYFKTIENDENREIETYDATYLMAYSVVMLNTDQHNPQVRHRMTVDDFRRNLRGYNGTKDFDPEYLQAIYNDIRKNEIVMPEEHEGELGFSYRWKNIVLSQRQRGSFVLPEDCSVYHKNMINIVWNPVLTAIFYWFDSAEDYIHLHKAILGYDACYDIAYRYELSDMLDTIISNLLTSSGLLRDFAPPSKRRSQRTVIDKWLVIFGKSLRRQYATICLFSLIREKPEIIVARFMNQIVEIARNLFLHSALPDSLLNCDDFINGTTHIPIVFTNSERLADNNSRREMGIFSTISNLLSLAGASSFDDEDSEETPENVDSQRTALSCMNLCNIADVFNICTEQAIELQPSVLIAAIIQSSFAKNGSPNCVNGVILKKRDSIEKVDEHSPVVSSDESSGYVLLHSGAAFNVELLVKVALLNRDSLPEIWPKIFGHLDALINASHERVPFIAEFVISALLRVIFRLASFPEHAEIVVETLRYIVELKPKFSDYSKACISVAVYYMLKSQQSSLLRRSYLKLIFHSVRRSSGTVVSAKFNYESLIFLLEHHDQFVTVDYVGDWADVLCNYIVSLHSIRSQLDNNSQELLTYSQAIENAATFLKHCTEFITFSSDSMSISQQFYIIWIPILSTIAQCSCHPFREIRARSMNYLQVLSFKAPMPNSLFDSILFPLLADLLRPEADRIDGKGMAETRATAVSCITKIFLARYSELKSPENIYAQILQFIRATIATDRDKTSNGKARLDSASDVNNGLQSDENDRGRQQDGSNSILKRQPSTNADDKSSLRSEGRSPSMKPPSSSPEKMEVGHHVSRPHSQMLVIDASLESLKNLLLVLHSQDVLRVPTRDEIEAKRQRDVIREQERLAKKQQAENGSKVYAFFNSIRTVTASLAGENVPLVDETTTASNEGDNDSTEMTEEKKEAKLHEASEAQLADRRIELWEITQSTLLPIVPDVLDEIFGKNATSPSLQRGSNVARQPSPKPSESDEVIPDIVAEDLVQ